MSTSLLIVSVLYTGIGYRLSQREFSARNRPFLKIDWPSNSSPVYAISQIENNRVGISFEFNVQNVGPIPAYDVNISSRLFIGDEEDRLAEPDNSVQVIFPGDTRLFLSSHSYTRKDRKLLTVEDFRRETQDKKLILRCDITYRGVQSHNAKPYYSKFVLSFPSETRVQSESIEADRVQ